jgi:hypothetical protein
MVNDENLVLLEGVITGNIYKSDNGGKVALNFTIESKKYNSEGEERNYPHPVVVFDPLSTKYESRIKNGTYVKGRGHLMAQTISIVDDAGKTSSRAIDKVVLDYIETDE